MVSSTWWKQLVRERDKWIAHNFPNADSTDTILGVIEEYGELTHSYLKNKQAIRGTSSQHFEDMQDAIGDMTVYLLGVMSHSHKVPLKTPDFKFASHGDELIFSMSRPVNMICYYQFQPAVKSPMEDLVGMMIRFCELYDWDYHGIVEDTWNGVSQRNWIAYPADGKTH